MRRARLVYRRRRERLITALGRHAPQARVTGISAGLNALVPLPPGRREEELVAEAARHGLALDGLGEYTAAGHQHRPALIIGYATPPGHAFSAALARLCAVLGPADGQHQE